MRHLPDELVLHIISFLEPEDLVKLQQVSRQFLNLSRDNNLWKRLCFEHSAAERRRRRLLSTSDVDPRLAELIRAADTIAGSFSTGGHDPTAPDADIHIEHNADRRRAALLANWDPAYPDEKVDFYSEFIQRHAKHSISWFQDARHGHQDDRLRHEATGAGILYDADGLADKLIAPLEDGSISIWEASPGPRQGRIIARARTGLLTNKGPDLDYDTRLTQSQSIMTETGAVECVALDARQHKAYFAVQNVLNEVDLHTLHVVSRTPYPFPITALSDARHPTPLTVGTNWTVHLHDTRKPPATAQATRCELIAGAGASSSSSFSRLQTGDFAGHVPLSQPGALSILHPPADADIWLAGRFTSILNFDRRFFPRLRGTLHSGARLSCLTSLPYPFVARDASPAARRDAKAARGITLVAAGEYKGKGSLEVYGLEPDGIHGAGAAPRYQNRQTASRSKLLSVAAHGTRLVFSDGDGNLKWVERDSCTAVRSLNINESGGEGGLGDGGAPREAGWGDIVQKILPVVEAGARAAGEVDVPLGRDGVVVWTGEGRLGMVGFGGVGGAFGESGDDEEMLGVAEEAAERELRSRERQYGVEMRKALEQQARELRWLRGYGL